MIGALYPRTVLQGVTAGTISASSSLTGALTVTAPIASTVSSTSSLNGALTVTDTLAGSVAATSTLNATLTATDALTGAISATSTLTGNLTNTGTVHLTGTITASSTLTGTAAASKPLTASIAATSTLTGTATLGDPPVVVALASEIDIASTLTGALSNTPLEPVAPPLRRYAIHWFWEPGRYSEQPDPPKTCPQCGSVVVLMSLDSEVFTRHYALGATDTNGTLILEDCPYIATINDSNYAQPLPADILAGYVLVAPVS